MVSSPTVSSLPKIHLDFCGNSIATTKQNKTKQKKPTQKKKENEREREVKPEKHSSG